MRRSILKNAHRFLLGFITTCCGLLTTQRIASAQAWTQTTAPSTNWMAVASSADGSVLAAAARGPSSPYLGPIFVSTNGGSNWTQTSAPLNYWSSIASSADGTKLVASATSTSYAGPIYTSTNAGISWTKSGAPLKAWVSVASSADGERLVSAVNSGLIYVSTNSGVDWTPTASSRDWLAVASSADATKLVAVGNNGIFTSPDSGVTWTSNSITAPYPNWLSVASSVDGTKLVAGMGGNGGWIYTRSGANWISNNVPVTGWHSIASSADGSKLVAGCYPAIFTSTNSGAVWVSNNAPASVWRALASSADGTKLVAVASPGRIYTWQSTPAPSLNVTSADGNLKLSWLVPSANFALQQNVDLGSTNWVTLTNAPTLNHTNLQNEIILPASGFYRLVSPG